MNPVINRQDSTTLKNEGKPVRVNPYLIRVNQYKVKLKAPPPPSKGSGGCVSSSWRLVQIFSIFAFKKSLRNTYETQ